MLNRYKIIKKVTIVGIVLNTLLVIMKIIFGILGNSNALLIDGIHSLSDTFSDFFILLCAFFASKEKDDNHPYGHQRIETAAIILLSLLLIFAGLYLLYYVLINGFSTYVYPHKYTLIIALLSIFLNEFLFRYTLKYGKKINSDLLIANAWHNRSDVFASVIVFIGILGSILGFPILDSIAAIIVAIIIIKIGIKWGFKAIRELIDTAADPDIVRKIEHLIIESPGVQSLHNLRTRMMANNIFLDAHIQVNNNITASEGHYIGETVRANLAENINIIKDITIHIDTELHDEELPHTSQLPPSKENIINKIKDILINSQIEQYISSYQIAYDKGKIKLYLYFNIQVLDIKTIEQMRVISNKMIRKINLKLSITMYYHDD